MLMLLWFLWFMNFSVRTIFSPLMPLIEDEFAIRHARASSFFMFNALGYGAALLLAGTYAGQYGYKRSILVSIILAACAFFLIPFVNSFTLLCVISVVLGLATGIYLPSVIPMITAYYNRRTWGKAIAIHDSAASVSIFAAPFIVLFLMQYISWRQIFDVFGVLSLVCAGLFYIAAQEVKVPPPDHRVHGNLFRSLSLWMISLLWIFASGANLGVYFILPLYLVKELHMDGGHANELFGFSRVGGVFVAIFVGFVVDRFSLKKTMFWLMLTTGILTVCLTFTGGRALEIFLYLQAAVGFGFFPVGLVALSRLFPESLRGRATGYVVTLGVVFGLGVIPYLLGLAGDHFSFRSGILIMGFLAMLSSLLTVFLRNLD